MFDIVDKVLPTAPPAQRRPADGWSVRGRRSCRRASRSAFRAGRAGCGNGDAGKNQCRANQMKKMQPLAEKRDGEHDPEHRLLL